MVSSNGLVGAVICDGEYIVTSPNANTIFNPPLGGDCSLFLRTNLRFGDDDPLQWPQPWVPEYPHLPCISLVPRQTSALLNCYDYFHSILLLNEPSMPTQMYPPTTARVMGVFTTDLMVCDAFFQAGIPVWLVRPFSVLSSMRVKALAHIQTPGDLTPLNPATHPSHPTIYCGSGDHINKYRVIARHVQHYLQYPNPFWSICAKTSIVPLPCEESSKCEACRQLYSPCRFLL